MRVSSKSRNALSDAAFAGPHRTFPVHDKAHARAAISGATRSANAGNISKGTEAKVKAKARVKLKK